MKQLMSKSVLGKLVGLKKIAFWLHEACTYCLAFYEIPLHFIGSVQSIFFCAILWSVIMFSLSLHFNTASFIDMLEKALLDRYPVMPDLP